MSGPTETMEKGEDALYGVSSTYEPADGHTVAGNMPPHKDGHLEGSDMEVFGHAERVEYTAEEGRAVLWKLDLILLPLLCGSYIFSFLDKTLLNFSSIFGLKTALRLEGSDYSWTGSIASFGYVVGCMPYSKLIQAYPQHVGKIIAGSATIWSIISLLTPLCTNFTGLMVNRFFLGLIESCTGPVFVVVTSNWWTREEQAFRTAFWAGGTPIGNFIGGLLSYAVGSMKTSMPRWKLFYVFFGSLSLGFAIVMCLLMPDHQANARWLNARQKKIAIERVRANQNVTIDHHWKWSQFWEALKDPQTWFFFVIAIGVTMPSTFASQFSSQIVHGFGFAPLPTTIISTCPASTIQFTTFLGTSWLAGRYKNKRLILSTICSIPPLIGASLLHSLPESNTAGRLAGYYLNFTHTMPFTFAASLVASNIAGYTKKTTISGLVYVGYGAGLIAGPQFFLTSQAPTYEMAFEMLMVCYIIMVILPLVQFAYYRWENGKRDRRSGLSNSEIMPREAEFTDLTDREQWETFRYTM